MKNSTEGHKAIKYPGLISVVMPCYNAVRYLPEAVNSVMEQSYKNIELIVVDDGSMDNSMEVLKSLRSSNSNRIHLLFQNRMGPYPARNKGLSQAKGEFVAFLDADDMWRTDCLERLFQAIEENRADLAYCGWQNFGVGAPGTEAYVPPAYEEGDPVIEFLRSCPWPIHAALIRRSIIDAVGGFSEQRFSSMDYDLWLRILGHTRRITRVTEVMAYYRWHTQGQVSSVKWRQVLDALAAKKTFLRRHPQLVGHLPHKRLKELTEGQVLRQAYRAVWQRDLASAQRLFRHVVRTGVFRTSDLRHVAAALLPMPLYRRVVELADRKQP